jgi:hypothetical protein
MSANLKFRLFEKLLLRLACKPVWYELLIVTMLLGGFYILQIKNTPFFADESDWIANSQFMEAFFTGKFDPAGFHAAWGWSETYWSMEQPKLAQYLIGWGRRIGGYQVKDLNLPWDWTQDEAGNRSAGRIPSPGLLWWARLPMAVLAALTGGLGFWLVGQLGGRLSAYAFAALFTGSNFLQQHISRAMSEASLLFFVLLACLPAAWLLKLLREALEKKEINSGSGLKTLGWAALTGGVIGLAGASKINGLLEAAGAGLLILLIVLVIPGEARYSLRLSLFIRVGAVLSLAALMVFVLLNPMLYPQPLTRLGRMIKLRTEVLEVQQRDYPQNKIEDFGQRLQIVPRRVLQDYMPLNFSGAWGVNIVLLGLGLCFLAWQTVRWLRGGQEEGRWALAILGLPSVLLAAALMTPLDWDRYYLMPVFFGLIFLSCGFGGWLQWIIMRNWIER